MKKYGENLIKNEKWLLNKKILPTEPLPKMSHLAHKNVFEVYVSSSIGVLMFFTGFHQVFKTDTRSQLSITTALVKRICYERQ
jgi:hypothetical protein